MDVKKPSVDLTYSIPFLSHLSWMNPLTFQVSKLCISFCTAHVESLISANGLEIDSLLLVINVVVVERENWFHTKTHPRGCIELFRVEKNSVAGWSNLIIGRTKRRMAVDVLETSILSTRRKSTQRCRLIHVSIKCHESYYTPTILSQGQVLLLWRLQHRWKPLYWYLEICGICCAQKNKCRELDKNQEEENKRNKVSYHILNSLTTERIASGCCRAFFTWRHPSLPPRQSTPDDPRRHMNGPRLVLLLLTSWAPIYQRPHPK